MLISVCIVISLCLEFIDTVLSTNVSRSHHVSISTEYFVDQQKYFYLMFLHLSAGFIVGGTATIATGSLLLAYLLYFCGMFKIASYRIKKTIHIYTLKDLSMQKEILVNKHLIRAVNIHRKCMTYSNYLKSRFEISFIFLMALGVLSISLNIFRVRIIFYKSVLIIC
ncbi:PREDICTED: uncharacterized protein LOC108691150, partial [Atta colombica]|uniref:uncharacterized protein LOC108691150 n=1 Tax=Atta colombica TaxID=520822 RepID=UPI00084BF885